MEDFQRTSTFTKSFTPVKEKIQLFFKDKRVRRVGSIFLISTGVGISLLFILFWLVYFGAFGEIPENQELSNIRHNNSSEIYSADGKLLGKYYIENRSNVSFEDISPELVHALVATEDARFYEHSGIDPRSMLRVIFKSILLRDKSAGGGSTLSQQLAKNLFPREDYSILSLPVAKFKEMIIAKRLEKTYSKDEILTLYLNTVPFGEKVYGIDAACQRFFNTNAKDISTQNAAVLVGMLKATTAYNPRRNPLRSKDRRDVVLAQMAHYNYLTEAEVDSLQELPLELDYNKVTLVEGPAPYFRQQVAEELKAWFRENRKPDGSKYNVYTDGLKIYTTIDSRLQEYAEEAIASHLRELQKTFDKHWKGRSIFRDDDPQILKAMRQTDRYRYRKEEGKSEAEILKHFQTPTKIKLWTWEGMLEKEISPLDSIKFHQAFLQAGFMAMDPQKGYVKAWVGGINFKEFKYDHVLAKRQVGSTFKPFVYTAALAKGMDPCEYIENQQVVYEDYENWSPGNADGKYEGYYSLQGGLTKSVNTVSAAVMNKVGVEDAHRFVNKFGFESDIPKAPSMVLGTAELSLKEMLSAYTVFANRGYRTKAVLIKKVLDAQGNVIVEWPNEREAVRVVDEKTADMMNYMLRSVVNQGTGQRLRTRYGLTNQIGGKTGTTQDQTDGWFIGITPKLVAGVWVGGETRKVRFRSLGLGQGANTALPIYGKFMQKYYQRFTKHRSYKFRDPAPSALKDMNCDLYREHAPGEGLEEFFLILKQKRMERQIRNMERKMQKKIDRNDRRRKRRRNNSRFKRNYRN
ncbi:MAG: PBP1A family penicillin-binding protein [Bacteroidota bacterium]